MPSEYLEEDEEWAQQEVVRAGGGDNPVAGLPANVAAAMQHFIQTITAPHNELEQQIQEEVVAWSLRHDQPPRVASHWAAAATANGGASTATAGSAGGEPARPIAMKSYGHGSCSSRALAGSSMSNSHCSSPSWSSASGGGGMTAGGGGGGSGATSRSSSEEGSSAAWRLRTWLLRAGFPVEHCASIRGGSAGGGGGWKFCSGHEFLILHPDLCGGPSAVDAADGALAGSGVASDTAGVEDMVCDGGLAGNPGPPAGLSRSRSSGMAAAVAAAAAADAMPADVLVIDPEFSTQFALASPTARYQVLVSLLPRIFVGTSSRLQTLVEFVCREMQGSFLGTGSGQLPPWRTLTHMLHKWRLHDGSASAVQHPQERLGSGELAPEPLHGWQQGQEQGQGQGQGQKPPAVQHVGWETGGSGGGGGGSGGGAAGRAAFSDEQQQAMRTLLRQCPQEQEQQHQQQQQEPGAWPPSLSQQQQGDSGGSMASGGSGASISTTIGFAALGGHRGAGAGSPPPPAGSKSLLTQELSQQQQSAAKAKHTNTSGAAASILCMAQAPYYCYY